VKLLGTLLALASVGLFAGAFYVEIYIADYMLIASFISLVLAIWIEAKGFQPKYSFIGSNIEEDLTTENTKKTSHKVKSESKIDSQIKSSNLQAVKMQEAKNNNPNIIDSNPATKKSIDFISEPNLDWDEELNFKP
jgi:hypothetical protein